jgi:hypothetical protein
MGTRYERYFYYEPADYMACEEHMAEALGNWFPEVSEDLKGALWNYEGWDIESLITALTECVELTKHSFCRLGTRMGPVKSHCQSLH